MRETALVHSKRYLPVSSLYPNHTKYRTDPPLPRDLTKLEYNANGKTFKNDPEQHPLLYMKNQVRRDAVSDLTEIPLGDGHFASVISLDVRGEDGTGKSIEQRYNGVQLNLADLGEDVDTEVMKTFSIIFATQFALCSGVYEKRAPRMY